MEVREVKATSNLAFVQEHAHLYPAQRTGSASNQQQTCKETALKLRHIGDHLDFEIKNKCKSSSTTEANSILMQLKGATKLITCTTVITVAVLLTYINNDN